MALQQDGGPINTASLFTGAGGGLLGESLFGWRPMVAVEIDAFARSRLLQRQREGHLPTFPIWSDIRTFDGTPWRGHIHVVTGGFPCQDISLAGKGDGLDGERSGLWSEMARIIGQIQPPFVFVENSPMLDRRGLDRVLGDLAALGYDARWGVVAASDAGASHNRARIWILASHFSMADTDLRRHLHRKLEEHAAEGRVEALGEPESGSTVLANAVSAAVRADRLAKARRKKGAAKATGKKRERVRADDSNGSEAGDVANSDSEQRDGAGRMEEQGGGSEPSDSGEAVGDPAVEGLQEREGERRDQAEEQQAAAEPSE